MFKSLRDKPAWMKMCLAALIILCLTVCADVLLLIVEYRQPQQLPNLADSADIAPPQGSATWGQRPIKARPTATPTPEPAVSPQPSASPDAENPDAIASAETPAAASDSQTSEASSYAAASMPSASSSDAGYAGWASAPASGLPANREISLQGVMLGGGTGIAVVEFEGETYTVGPGENIGPYKVVDIEAERVTLEKDGRKSEVAINDSQASAPTSAVATSTVGNYPPVLPKPNDVPLPPQPVSLHTNSAPSSYASTTSSSRNSASDNSASGNSSSGNSSFELSDLDVPRDSGIISEESKLTREELDEFTRKGAALMADIRGSEVENARGVRVQFRNPDNALAKLGLKDGDVVLRINSRSVVGVEDIYNAVLTLRDAPQVDIDIMRNNQPMSLFHEFPERDY